MLDEKQAHLCIWVMRRACLLFSSVLCQVLFWWRTFIMMLKTTRRLKNSVRLTWNIHISMMLLTNFNQYYSQSKSFWFIYVWQCCIAKAGYGSIRMISKRWLSKHTVEFPSICFFLKQPTSCSGTFSLSFSRSSCNGCGWPFSARANYQ